jgi:biofilm protein TabA
MQRRDFVVGLAASSLVPRLAHARDLTPVVGTLAQWKTLASTKGLEPAFEYLSQIDPAKVAPGRTAIIGEDVYAAASQYATKPASEPRLEAHRKYIDIQCLVSGQETVGFIPSIEGLTVVTPYDAAKDVEFYGTPASETRLALQAGQFVVLYPGQAHRPGCDLDGSHDVVKIVVKVSAAWLAGRERP